MKRLLIITLCLLSFLVISAVIMGHSNWHVARNANNKLPAGLLTQVKDTLYRDTAGREWVLLPASMNTFHQPDHTIVQPTKPYGDAIIPTNFVYDPENPNLKFLSKTADGGSYEAILQPDGTYLLTGPQLGTYNYGHPEGLLGMLRHAFWDVLPHFANGHYE